VHGDWLPALNVVEVEARYKPLLAICSKTFTWLMITPTMALDAQALPDGVVLLGKSGKFNKARLTMAGGSVGLFEGKRIGRAKNLENLAKEIKQLETQLAKLKSKSEELQSTLVALKAEGKADEIGRSNSK
jgi:chromosome segregation protein